MSEIRVGTSGFAYKEWKPSFYPEDVAQTRFLEYYSSRLRAVEIDYTFYRMPTRKTLEAWSAATGDDFRFALKASRKITHFERLRVPSDALDYLQDTVGHLGPRLGMMLYQLPPNFRKDLDRLASFLAGLDRHVPAAFEFRHDSWFGEDVYSLLRGYGIALVIHDADDHTTPMELTAPRTYVRLRRSEYSDAERRTWIERWRSWTGSGTDVYAFVKHEDNPDAPIVAGKFAHDAQ
jgi:uncharacterized protein YecE (DUF72 family)